MIDLLSANPIIGILVATVAVYIIFKILGFFGTLIKIGLAIAIFLAIVHWFG